MIYICPECRLGYTIPVSDRMIYKKINCVCGCDSWKFEVGEVKDVEYIIHERYPVEERKIK